HKVRLAATTTQRLVLQNQFGIDVQIRRRNKEPLPLPKKRFVPSPVPILRPNAQTFLTLPNEARLQSLHSRSHAGESRNFWNRGHKPRPFVMTAQEFVLVATFAVTSHQQEVADFRLQMHNFDQGIAARHNAEFEEFAITVVVNIDRDCASNVREAPAS